MNRGLQKYNFNEIKILWLVIVGGVAFVHITENNSLFNEIGNYNYVNTHLENCFNIV